MNTSEKSKDDVAKKLRFGQRPTWGWESSPKKPDKK